jgi:glycosyltransferase involved in cell wall biosynthesis
MNILHIITDLDDGGAEAVLYRLICHDQADEHQVISLTCEGKYGPLLRQAGATVSALNMPRGRVALGGLWRLWQAVRSSRADVAQTWMHHSDLLGGLAARSAGVPVVWGIRNTMLEPGISPRSTLWVARLCARLSYRIPRRIVSCAQKAAQVHTVLGYDAARMLVIPNGYDLARFAPHVAARDRLRAEWQIPSGVPLIGMVARFDPYKDHGNLMAALACLREKDTELCVVLVGNGVDTTNPALMAMVESAGLSDWVKLIGPRGDIPAVMSAFDVHVLSSSAEAFPNVLAEAMACGTPCVSTDVGDAALICGDTGWVVPPNNPGALAEALAKAIAAGRDAEGWRKRQQRARDHIAQEFAVDTMVARYRQVWRECLLGRS